MPSRPGAGRVRAASRARLNRGVVPRCGRRSSAPARRGAGLHGVDAPRLPSARYGHWSRDPVRRQASAEAHPVARPFASRGRGTRRTSAVSAALHASGSEVEVGRERSRPRLDPGVHSAHIGGDPAPWGRTEVIATPPRRRWSPSTRSRRLAPGSTHLGEACRADTPVHLHLPHPVLRRARSPASRASFAPSHGCAACRARRVSPPPARKAGQGQLADDLGERAAQPEQGARRRQRDELKQGEQSPPQPFRNSRHASRGTRALRLRPLPSSRLRQAFERLPAALLSVRLQAEKRSSSSRSRGPRAAAHGMGGVLERRLQRLPDMP